MHTVGGGGVSAAKQGTNLEPPGPMFWARREPNLKLLRGQPLYPCSTATHDGGGLFYSASVDFLPSGCLKNLIKLFYFKTKL